MSLWILSGIFFEVSLKENAFVTLEESGYWKPEAEECIDLDDKQSIPRRENGLETVQSSDRSRTWGLWKVWGAGVALWTQNIAGSLFKERIRKQTRKCS